MTYPNRRGDNPKLLFIVGPTAAGKTEFALQAAKEFKNQKVEIINSDSIQVYQGIEIGTAKPTKEQREQIKHHLVDTIKTGDTYTAGRFRDDATQIIKDGAKRGVDWFLIVGGSGFYVQALEKGMFDVKKVDPQFRAQLAHELKTNGLETLYLELKQRDDTYAAKVKPQDTYRTLRALELMRAHNKTMTQIHHEFDERQQNTGLRRNYDIHKIGLKPDRNELRQRVQRRTQSMLEHGLVEEVRGLLAEGLKDWAPLQSVGYREVQGWLADEVTDERLPELITTSTMQLAKRQMTWFQRDPETHWAPSQPEFAEALQTLRRLLPS